MSDLENETFDALMKAYGWLDIAGCIQGAAFRLRAYHDGGWLEGYKVDPVVYWGA